MTNDSQQSAVGSRQSAVDSPRQLFKDAIVKVFLSTVDRRLWRRFIGSWQSGVFLIGFVVTGILPAFCFSQTPPSSAGIVTPLSALGASARADALGGALVGLADDPSALFLNSAGLSQLRSISLSVNHNSYLAGSFEETLLFGLPAGSLGGFAGALQYVSWGNLDERNADGVYQGSFTDGDAAFSLAWGMPIVDRLSFGLALHGSEQKIVDSLYTGLSGDLGVLWNTVSDFRLGLNYSGLGTSEAGYTPAQDLRLGCSEILKWGSGSCLIPLLVVDWQPNGVSRAQGGLEGTIERDYSLRVGYQGALSDNQIGGLTGFTAGAGVKVGPFQVDYAFVPYGELGTSHRVSLGYEFPNPTPIISKPVTVISHPVTVMAPPVTVVASPQPVPVPAGAPKSKVEVRFELPSSAETQMVSLPTGAQAASLTAPYEKAVQDNPQDSRLWRTLGIVYFKAGQTAQAVQCLEQALRLKPDDLALKQWLDDYHTKYPTKP